MRTTPPTLRRRNYAQKQTDKRWLARRDPQRDTNPNADGLDTDGSDTEAFLRPRVTRDKTRRSLIQPRGDSDDDGFASGEDSELDSDNEADNGRVLTAPTRSVSGTAKATSSAGLSGANVVSIGTGNSGAASGATRPGVVNVGGVAPSRAAAVGTTFAAVPSRAASSRAVAPVPTLAVGSGGAGKLVTVGTGAAALPPPSLVAARPVVARPVASGVAPGGGSGFTAVPPSTLGTNLGGSTGLVVGGAAAPGLPSSTLGAAEDEEDGVTSESDSDGFESGDLSDSDSADSADEATRTTSVPGSTPAPTLQPALGAPPVPTNLIGAPAGSPVTAITPTPTGILAAPSAPVDVAQPLLPSSDASQPTNTETGPNADLPTLGLPTPSTGLSELQGDANGAITAEQNRPNTGAAAGIAIGVLAGISIVVALTLLWRKWRGHGRKLPQLPLFWGRSKRDDDPEMTYNRGFEPDTIPILPPPKSMDSKKTNSEMMDQLMQATFKAEGGMDDRNSKESFTGIPGQAVPLDSTSERAVQNVGPGFVDQRTVQGRAPGFMDETAYTALAGPPTPAPTKPVIHWLDNVKTPRSSEGPAPVRWPTSAVPAMPTMSVPFQAESVPVGKPPPPQFLPPQPAYMKNNPRYTTTTTTTATSSSTEDFWFR